MTNVWKETSNKTDMAQVKKHLGKIIKKTILMNERKGKLPQWLKRPLAANDDFSHTRKILEGLKLETICTNANCPNCGQCWSRGTATVLILGNVCTRNCKFCSVAAGKPLPPDPTEPHRLAQMAFSMGLKYLVITSVDRDDLEDAGAGHFADCVNTVRVKCPGTNFEILVPDFRDCQKKAVEILTHALPFVFAHNVETVPSLYSIARSGGNYQVSLNLLKLAKDSWPDVPTKTSIMLGLGESDDEVEQVFADLQSVGCERITIGQYLKPSKDSLDVVEYVTPDKFAYWKNRATAAGFKWVISEPFARSSYFAEKNF